MTQKTKLNPKKMEKALLITSSHLLQQLNRSSRVLMKNHRPSMTLPLVKYPQLKVITRCQLIQRKKKKAKDGRGSIQDLKLTNKMLLEKCTEISNQFKSALTDEDKSSEIGSKLEKMQMKNQKRKDNLKQKKKAKKEKQKRSVSLSLSESDSVQLDPELLKIAENFPQLGLCRDAEMKYFSS